MTEYLEAMLSSFVNDPPDTDYQRGYLAALLDVSKDNGIFGPQTVTPPYGRLRSYLKERA